MYYMYDLNNNLNKKYLTFIPFLALNFYIKEINANILSNSQINKTKISSQIHLKNFQKNKNFLIQSQFNKFVYLISEKINYSNKEDNFKNLEIISDYQTKSEKEYIAEGNVQIRKNNMLLQTDKLVYDYEKREIKLLGNVKFSFKEQFFLASHLNYNLESKTGLINDVYGTINFDKLDLKLNNNIDSDSYESEVFENSIRDVKLNKSSSFELDDIKSPQKLKLEINNMVQWRFQSEEIKIDNGEWSSKVLYLTNDPFNQPQLVIKNSNFKSFEKNGDFVFKSKWSSIILEDKIKVPIGPRNFKAKKGSNFRWGIGYEVNNKDGLYITRYSDQKSFGKTNLNLKNEFYIQRALSGKTKSFSKENDSVLAEKVQQDAKISDFFGISADLNSKIFGLDLNSEIALNSLDLEKFKKIINVKSELSKVLHESKNNDLEKEVKLSLFGIYRDSVWNGSIGEKDILTSYGLKLENKQNWGNNKVSKSSNLAAGYGEYQSNKKSTKENIISRERLNLLWYREHNYHILKSKDDSPINKEFRYIPENINKGLDFLLSSKVDLYNYNDGNYQNLITFKAGPKITLGNFKKKYLDYSEISIFGKTTIANGESPFDFDQSVDNHFIEIDLKQQLIGPLVIKYSTEYNLDVNSSDFHEFSNRKYELSWNRRAFNIGIFYNEDRQAGGINFEINGFNFKGYGDEF